MTGGPEAHMAAVAESVATTPVVEAFLTSNTFYCIKMRSRLTPNACERRQKDVKLFRAGGMVFKAVGSTLDIWCRSGQCQQGKEILVQLKKD